MGPGPAFLVFFLNEEVWIKRHRNARAQRGDQVGTREKVATCRRERERETSEETHPADTLSLDFQPPELRDGFLLLAPSLWYDVTAA